MQILCREGGMQADLVLHAILVLAWSIQIDDCFRGYRTYHIFLTVHTEFRNVSIWSLSDSSAVFCGLFPVSSL